MARLGGPFGMGTPPIPVQLTSGEVFYIPPGDYQVSLGAVTIMQVWDQANLIWRNLSSPFGVIEISSDGFNFRLVNFSGIVQGGRITNAGSGATANGIGSAATGVGVSFGAAPANGVAATAYPIVGGQINSTITITNGGSGFVVPPILVFDPPPPGGISAAATCTISGGIINAVTVVNQGAGYVTAPNCYIIPQWATYQGIGPPVNVPAPSSIIPPGALGTVQPPWFAGVNWPLNVPLSGGAVLTVNPTLVGGLTLTGLVMTNYGQGYTSAAIPTIAFTGIAGGVAATAIMAMSLQSIVITAAGVAYATATHLFESTLGLLATATSYINNNAVGNRPARGQAIAAATTISSTVIEDVGFGFQANPVLAVTASQGTPPTTVANLTPTTGGVTDVCVLQPAVQT